MFYLIKFADLYSHSDHNNTGVCIGPLAYLSALHSIYQGYRTRDI